MSILRTVSRVSNVHYKPHLLSNSLCISLNSILYIVIKWYRCILESVATSHNVVLKKVDNLLLFNSCLGKLISSWWGIDCNMKDHHLGVYYVIQEVPSLQLDFLHKRKQDTIKMFKKLLTKATVTFCDDLFSCDNHLLSHMTLYHGCRPDLVSGWSHF